MPKRDTFATNDFTVPERTTWEVQQTNPRSDMIGIRMPDGSKYPFGKKTRAFQTRDPGFARAVQQIHGQDGTNDVLVTPLPSAPEPGHPRTFTVPELPWHRNKDKDNG